MKSMKALKGRAAKVAKAELAFHAPTKFMSSKVLSFQNALNFMLFMLLHGEFSCGNGGCWQSTLLIHNNADS